MVNEGYLDVRSKATITAVETPLGATKSVLGKRAASGLYSGGPPAIRKVVTTGPGYRNGYQGMDDS